MALQQSQSKTSFRKHVFALIGENYGDKTLCLCPTGFVRLFRGDHKAAILLSQILYWSERTNDSNGWFYKSYASWTAETGLSEAQVRRIVHGDRRTKQANVTLTDIGVETRIKKVKSTGAPTVWYRVNQDKFLQALQDFMGQGDSEQCADPFLNIVPDENSTMLGMNSEHCTASLDQDSEIKSRDQISEDQDHQPDEDSDLGIFLAHQNRFGKPKPPVKEALREQLDQLGAEKIQEVLERCATRGRSWAYVLKALQQEVPAAQEAVPETQWSDFSALDNEEGRNTATTPEKPSMPVSERVQIAWRSSLKGEVQTVQDCFNAAYHQMQMQFDHASFDAWLRGAELVDFDPEKEAFVVVVRHELACTMLSQRYYRTVKRILQDVYGSTAEICFLTVEEWGSSALVGAAVGAA